jgi:hypothetical protein
MIARAKPAAVVQGRSGRRQHKFSEGFSRPWARLARSVSIPAHVIFGDKREIDKATWRKPFGIGLTPTSRYIRNKLDYFPAQN